MMEQKSQVNLYQENVTDLRDTLTYALKSGYDSVTIPIVHPKFVREYRVEPMKTQHIAFSRSDLLLKSKEWLNGVVSKISSYIDVDSADDTIRRHSEETLLQEISFAEHLIQHGYVLIKLKSANNVNLARTISQNIKELIQVEIPMSDPNARKLQWRGDVDQDSIVEEDTWVWWNNFRLNTDHHFKIKIALEISENIPTNEEILRWLGEPIESIIIPSSLFLLNAHNYPVLSRAHQELVGAFIRNNCHFMVKANGSGCAIRNYADYIRNLISKFKLVSPVHGFEDILEIPLQPLYDNLDSYTYEVFEKDPVKYLLYQKAIEQALIDKVSEEEKKTKTLCVMVVGAGRGPLVRAAINASTNVQRKIKIFIIEKNPNAIITLRALVEELWTNKDIEIISCDMRNFVPNEKADIIISELLGSFGDNELSPECLDGAQKHLKPDGISIPCKSTSYLNPIMSQKLYNSVRLVDKTIHPRDRNHNYTHQAESLYVVHLKNCYHIDDPQPLFTFEHPNLNVNDTNARYKVLKFNAKLDCLLHGFVGYFDTVLYGDIMLSIHPATHTFGLGSWFSIYFPIFEPLQIKAGDVIEVHFWRCTSAHKVWYEWSINSPQITHIHNLSGRSYQIWK